MCVYVNTDGATGTPRANASPTRDATAVYLEVEMSLAAVAPGPTARLLPAGASLRYLTPVKGDSTRNNLSVVSYDDPDTIYGPAGYAQPEDSAVSYSAPASETPGYEIPEYEQAEYAAVDYARVAEPPLGEATYEDMSAPTFQKSTTGQKAQHTANDYSGVTESLYDDTTAQTFQISTMERQLQLGADGDLRMVSVRRSNPLAAAEADEDTAIVPQITEGREYEYVDSPEARVPPPSLPQVAESGVNDAASGDPIFNIDAPSTLRRKDSVC